MLQGHCEQGSEVGCGLIWTVSAPAYDPGCNQLGKSPGRGHFQLARNLSPVQFVGPSSSSKAASSTGTEALREMVEVVSEGSGHCIHLCPPPTPCPHHGQHAQACGMRMTLMVRHSCGAATPPPATPAAHVTLQKSGAHTSQPGAPSQLRVHASQVVTTRLCLK
ncbi:hypothetical protein P7K49_017173 [Saguinus oedipus]|uniref:Uncharacterized protein n=1 Tax=Saguinus oedipus TaxID=9490 RepID=A0ABQ9V280_SAGOE|nr:hypothetical protein P7K49_017173 [Saguinus oedipus]